PIDCPVELGQLRPPELVVGGRVVLTMSQQKGACRLECLYVCGASHLPSRCATARPVLTKRLREREVEGGGEAAEVVVAGRVGGAKGAQVWGRPLAVEEPAHHPIGVQCRDKRCNGDLGCVPLSVEHRLAGEEAADRHAVQPTAQTPITSPGLDRMSP